MNDIVLKVEGLTKSYGDLVAVNNIFFEVKKGQFFAFLGRNGAGKSTTIKMLTTLLKQDSGTFYLNKNSDDDYIRENIGVVFQENMLDRFLTVKENLLTRANLSGMSKSEIENRYNELVDQFSLKDFLNKQTRFLSGGQARRVEIARALFTRPKVLFLDEPTAGLDAESRKILWQILSNLQKENETTIFLTTHYMEETNNADYVVIINKGNILAQGTPSELKEKYSSDIFKVFPKNKKDFEKYLNDSSLSFEKIADSYVVKTKNATQTINVLSDNKKNITHFELLKGSMDDVFLEVVKNDEDVADGSATKTKSENKAERRETKNKSKAKNSGLTDNKTKIKTQKKNLKNVKQKNAETKGDRNEQGFNTF